MADESVDAKPTTITGDTHSEAAKQREAQADAAATEALEKILGPEGETEESKPARQRDPETGKFVAGDDKPTGEAADEAAEPVAKPTEAVNSEEYRRARKALELIEVPKKLLDTLSPQEIIEWGSGRARNHADVDRLKNRVSELERAQRPAPAEPAGEGNSIDWDQATKPLVEYFGDDAKDALKAFGESILAQAKPQDNDEIEQIKKRLIGQEQSAARDRLSRERGQLDESTWNRLLNYRLSDANEYGSEYEALDTAWKVCLADEQKAARSAATAEQHTARDNGVTTTAHGGSPPPARTNDDVETDILAKIMDGDREDARRIAAQHGRKQSNAMFQRGKVIGAPARR